MIYIVNIMSKICKTFAVLREKRLIHPHKNVTGLRQKWSHIKRM